jgi:Domain of unknown function (DUF4333)
MRLLLAALLAITIAGCGGGDSPRDDGQSDRSVVESAARSYIVSEQSDEEDPEEAGSLSFTKVEVQGDSAEVEAKSSSTGNRYEVDLSRSGNSWRGTAVLTDRPANPTQSGDPARRSGQRASTDQVETQIEQRLLKLVRIKGRAECPPEIRIRRANDFTCKVVGSSRPVTVEVTQKDDQGNLAYRISTGNSP